MRWDHVVTLATKWPEVGEAVSYDEPSLNIRKRLLAWHRVGDDSVVLLDVPPEEHDRLIEIMPEVFFVDLHYLGHEIVLARLAPLPADILTRRLERRWRNSASKGAVRDSYGSHPATPIKGQH